MRWACVAARSSNLLLHRGAHGRAEAAPAVLDLAKPAQHSVEVGPALEHGERGSEADPRGIPELVIPRPRSRRVRGHDLRRHRILTGEGQRRCTATFNNNVAYATAGMQQAVTLMRNAGYRGIIAIPGLNYANDMTSWLSHQPSDPQGQLIAEAHIYGNNVCGAQNNGECLTRTIGPVAQVVPVIFGETGETYDDSSCTGNNARIILPWADAHNVGYAAWTWNTWGTCGSLISAFNGTVRGSGYAIYVRDHLLTR